MSETCCAFCGQTLEMVRKKIRVKNADREIWVVTVNGRVVESFNSSYLGMEESDAVMGMLGAMHDGLIEREVIEPEAVNPVTNAEV